MRVLLLSAYAAHSHVQWRESLLAMFPDWQWTVLEMPPRHFSWRVRGNPLHWALSERDRLQGPWDLLLATSMVDLATLRGLAPHLAGVPSALYFHENQFAYPTRDGPEPIEAQMVSLYAAIAADKLLFNSNYNRESFLEGTTGLLRRLPDYVPAAVPERLEEKSHVLPVPLPMAVLEGGDSCWPGDSRDRPPRILWPARFEYDKGPGLLLAALRELERLEFDYELALVGQTFRQSPAEFAQIEQEFSHRLVHFGYLQARSDYLALLRAADIVVSTAVHEFQGLAVMEAVSAGCLPLVPDRLAYPEIYPEQFRYLSRPEEPLREARALAEAVIALWREREARVRELPDMHRFGSTVLREDYAMLFQEVIACAGQVGH